MDEIKRLIHQIVKVQGIGVCFKHVWLKHFDVRTRPLCRAEGSSRTWQEVKLKANKTLKEISMVVKEPMVDNYIWVIESMCRFLMNLRKKEGKTNNNFTYRSEFDGWNRNWRQKGHFGFSKSLANSAFSYSWIQYSIHPLSNYHSLVVFRVVGGCRSISQRSSGKRQESSPDTSPVQHRAEFSINLGNASVWIPHNLNSTIQSSSQLMKNVDTCSSTPLHSAAGMCITIAGENHKSTVSWLNLWKCCGQHKWANRHRLCIWSLPRVCWHSSPRGTQVLSVSDVFGLSAALTTHQSCKAQMQGHITLHLWGKMQK